LPRRPNVADSADKQILNESLVDATRTVISQAPNPNITAICYSYKRWVQRLVHCGLEEAAPGSPFLFLPETIQTSQEQKKSFGVL
jgi:hypothetical protein